MGIDFSKVAFTYNPQRKKRNNIYVIKDIDLSVDDHNEFIAVLGRTGSGKSTLVQLMNALLIPTLGEVKIDSNRITSGKQRNMKSIRKKAGLVFQFPEYQLFEETVLKDISFGPRNFKLSDPETRAKEAMKAMKIDPSFESKNPFMLSGGEIRKAAIAGILASDPEILILDEPTVGLDPVTKREFIGLLKEINRQRNKTIIIITHDMDVVWQAAGRVIVVDDRKIVYDGDKESFFRNREAVEKYSLGYPEIVSTMMKLQEKLGIEIDVFQPDPEAACKVLTEAMKNDG